MLITIHTDKGPKTVRVSVKSSLDAILKGLMGRATRLDDTEGALFDMRVDSDHGFWMRNTLIPLDMIFIDRNMRVVGIKHNVQPMSEKLQKAGSPSRFILEVDGGWSMRNGAKAGDVAEFSGSERSKTASAQNMEKDAQAIMFIRGAMKASANKLVRAMRNPATRLLIAGLTPVPGVLPAALIQEARRMGLKKLLSRKLQKALPPAKPRK